MGDRERRRSPVRSRRRSRANSYSDDYRSDDYTDYSDSFVSDDERSPPRRNKPATSTKNTRKTTTAPYKGTKGKGRNGLQKAATDLHSNPIARIMQAEKRMKMNEMKNALDGMTLKCRDLEEENKILKRLQRRQEKALTRFEGKESDLPQLLQRHTNEIRALKDQLRKAKEKNVRTERSLQDADTEKDSLRRQLNKYRDLAEDKGLPERDELHRRILAAEADTQSKDKKIAELERHLENLTKNHKHQLGIEMARHKDLQRKHEELTENFNRIQFQLKEKEKELDVKNIYANRLSRPPRQAVSYGGTPNESPSPSKTERQRRLSNSEFTPRQKAKLYEQERRQNQKKKTENEKKTSDKLAWEKMELDRIESENVRTENPEKDRREQENRERKAMEEKAIQERVEREEREIRNKMEEEKTRKDREQQRLAEERLRKQLEEKQEKERREREERERREKEERQRHDREQQEREEQARREHEERERQQRRAREEQERIENDAKLQEERKRKDDLLARLKKLDNTSEKIESSPFFLTNDHANSGTSSAASKKSNYSFTQATENMHNGKPAYEENPVPYLEKRKTRRSLTNEEEGYMPSFASSNNKPTQQRNTPTAKSDFNSTNTPSSNSKSKKSNLMDELFGKNREESQVASKKENSKDFNDFSLESKSTSRTKFPWEDASGDKISTASPSKPERQSSALFGGGSALIEDDTFLRENSSQLLPRRVRQQPTTFQSKPAVSAVDHFDDDLEEVIL